LYEVISTPRVKPFLDVEKDLAPGEDFVELESQFICAANSALADLCKIPLKEVENNLVWFSASKKGKKFSLHGILASRSCSMQQAGVLAKALQARLSPVFGPVVDVGIYEKNRNFRIPFNTKKDGEPRFLLPAAGNKAPLIELFQNPAANRNLLEDSSLLVARFLFRCLVGWGAWDQPGFFESSGLPAPEPKKPNTFTAGSAEDEALGSAMFDAFSRAVPKFAQKFDLEKVTRDEKDRVRAQLKRVGESKCICPLATNGSHSTKGGFLYVKNFCLFFYCWGSHSGEKSVMVAKDFQPAQTAHDLGEDDWNTKGILNLTPPEGFYEEVLEDFEAGETTTFKDIHEWLAGGLTKNPASETQVSDIIAAATAYFAGAGEEARGFKKPGSRTKNVPPLRDVIKAFAKITLRRTETGRVEFLSGFEMNGRATEPQIVTPKTNYPISLAEGQEPLPDKFAGIKNRVRGDVRHGGELFSGGPVVLLKGQMGVGKTILLHDLIKKSGASIYITNRRALLSEQTKEMRLSGIEVVDYRESVGPICLYDDFAGCVNITPNSLPRLEFWRSGWMPKLLIIDEASYTLDALADFIAANIAREVLKSGSEKIPNNLPAQVMEDLIKNVPRVVLADALADADTLTYLAKLRPEARVFELTRESEEKELTLIEFPERCQEMFDKAVDEEIAAGFSICFASNCCEIAAETFVRHQDKKTILITAKGYEYGAGFKDFPPDKLPASFKEAAGLSDVLIFSPTISAGSSYFNGERGMPAQYRKLFLLLSPKSTESRESTQQSGRLRSVKEYFACVKNNTNTATPHLGRASSVDEALNWMQRSEAGLRFLSQDPSLFRSPLTGRFPVTPLAFLKAKSLLNRHLCRNRAGYLKNLIQNLREAANCRLKEIVLGKGALTEIVSAKKLAREREIAELEAVDSRAPVGPKAEAACEKLKTIARLAGVEGAPSKELIRAGVEGEWLKKLEKVTKLEAKNQFVKLKATDSEHLREVVVLNYIGNYSTEANCAALRWALPENFRAEEVGGVVDWKKFIFFSNSPWLPEVKAIAKAAASLKNLGIFVDPASGEILETIWERGLTGLRLRKECVENELKKKDVVIKSDVNQD